MSTSVKKVLLLTDVFPCDNYSGALVSKQICNYLLNSNYKLYCACVHSVGVKEVKDEEFQAKITSLIQTKPSKKHLSQTEFETQLKTVEKNIVTFIQDNNIKTIWCPLQGEIILRVLNNIITEIKDVRIITQIWDPFEWFLQGMGYSAEEQKPLLKLFDKVIKKSSFVLTASYPMNEYFKEKYNVPCTPVFSAYEKEPSVKEEKDNKKFTIIISGQTYAKKGINSLLESLQNLNWKYKNKEIVIKYFGFNSKIFNKYKSHITDCGYVSQKELVKEQEKADLLYCSYYFDKTIPKSVATQSYPSKIITYIPSEVPILIHSEPNCPVYQDFKKYNCGFLLNSTDIKEVEKTIKEIINLKEEEKKNLINNSKKLFNTFFTKKRNKEEILKAFNEAAKSPNKKHILEINNIDLPGHIWNGYDLMNYLNTNTNYIANQICTYKLSNNDDVIKLYQTQKELDLEYQILQFESNTLSVHSCVSSSTPALEQNNIYKNADILHFHLIHNTKLSLFSLIRMCNEKPSIISIHDPWIFTGHCVHFGSCDKYLTGCHNCPNLNLLFPLKYDTASELWTLKELVYSNIDADYIVTTEYMYNLFKNCPLTKNSRVHLIPFGINVDKYAKISRNKAREHYKIPNDNIVLFHRAQEAFKGTNFLVDALKQLKIKQKITIITCGELGLLDEIKDRYNVIELGNIDDKELTFAYNACDIFMMPSIGESFGMMAVEAMSCSKPVICFDNTALPSVIHAPECGIAVENLNSTKLMEAIKYLVENKDERIRRGKLGRELVKNVYNIDVYNNKMLALYEEVEKRKHNFKKDIYQKEIEETQSVITLKKQLNSLTKKLFPKNTIQYKKLHYKNTKHSKLNVKSIKYSEVDTQLLLDQYGRDLYNNYLEDIKPPFTKRVIRKTTHYSKLFINLLKNDRKTLKELIKKRLKISR